MYATSVEGFTETLGICVLIMKKIMDVIKVKLLMTTITIEEKLAATANAPSLHTDLLTMMVLTIAIAISTTNKIANSMPNLLKEAWDNARENSIKWKPM